jgi:exopolysaccharide biosynthesis polyprenyl glycosylphosphotransferase
MSAQPQHDKKTFPVSSARPRAQLRVSERRALLMLGDVLAVLIAVTIALLVWAAVDRQEIVTLRFMLEQWFWYLVLPALWLILASANDFYDFDLAASRLQTLRRLMIITAQMLVVYLIVFFFSPRDALPRLFILYFGAGLLLLIALWRLVSPSLIGWASEARHTLIIGTDWAAGEIIAAIQAQQQHTHQLYGIIGHASQVGDKIGTVEVIGTPADLMPIVQQNAIRELIITSMHNLNGETFQAVMDAYQAGVSVVPMPLLYERLTGRVPVEHVNNNWTVVLPLEVGGAFSPYPFLKRAIDVGLALIGFVPFALLFPLIALVIKLDSRGPIFYSQVRVGWQGRTFRVYKFRSMRQDAESATGAIFAQQGDPRVTRFGRFMRKTRIDELPQLYNILRGDMSLIGPRPERPEHVERLQAKIPFYRTRLVIRPGLTGWAQVRYTYGSTDADALVKLQYDLYYIRHQSLLLDVNILIRTVGRVIRMSGV